MKRKFSFLVIAATAVASMFVPAAAHATSTPQSALPPNCAQSEPQATALVLGNLWYAAMTARSAVCFDEQGRPRLLDTSTCGAVYGVTKLTNFPPVVTTAGTTADIAFRCKVMVKYPNGRTDVFSLQQTHHYNLLLGKAFFKIDNQVKHKR